MKRIALALIVGIILSLNLVIPAFASLAPPNSITVLSAKVVRNTIVSGDMAVMFEGNINYTTLPTSPTADLTFTLKLFDGTTLLASQTPFVIFNAGYGKFAGSFYFDDTHAPTWGSGYVINIAGVSSYFSSPPTPCNYTLLSGDYSSFTTTSDNQSLAASYIIGIAKDLTTTYSLNLWT